MFDRIHRDSEVRAVVLSGKGEKAFTSGLDLEEAKRMAGGEGSAGEDPYRKSRKIKDAMKRWQEACSAVEKCAKRELLKQSLCLVFIANRPLL